MGSGFRLCMVLAVMLSALAVVAVKHESRKRFVELQALERTRDELNAHWGKLKLEGALWASHDRIQGEAESRLGMDRPAPGRIVVVEYLER